MGVVGPLGIAPAAVEMQLPALARAVPIAVGVVVLIAGTRQFTAWKAHHLACRPADVFRGSHESNAITAQGSVKTSNSLETMLLPHPFAPATKYARSPMVAAPKP